MTVASSSTSGIHAVRPRFLRGGDIAGLLVVNALLIVGMWLRHGGLDQLDSTSGTLTAIGQLTGLLGTYVALLQLVLMARIPWLEEAFGMDRLAAAHRWFGFACLWLLVGHGVFITAGYAMADRAPILAEAWTLLTTYPYVLMATVGMALFVAVAVSSIRAARRRLSYETWYGIHLYAYLAVALAFAHQLVVGADFIDDPVAVAYWVGLYVAVAAAILAFRVGLPIRRSLRHRFRVADVIQEAPGVVSVYLTGRELDQFPVRAGHYLVARFLTRDGWWRAHPFSISAAPNPAWLRLTIKDLGDYTTELQALRPGTRVFIEGPYGALTGARRSRRRVLLIAGGIGITPLRALLEELPASPGDLTLIYRAKTWDDVVFGEELETLARLRGARVLYLVGERGRDLPSDPLGAESLLALVPDLHQHDIYLCGPTGMMEATRQALRSIRFPASRIHLERFAY
jgi:predicted ferric reductase